MMKTIRVTGLGVAIAACLLMLSPARGQTSPVATPTVTSPIATPTEGWFPTPGPGTPYPTAVRLVEFKAHVVK